MLALGGLWVMLGTLRTGAFIGRGGRRIQRAQHPIIFWTNVAGLSLAIAFGLVLIATAVLLSQAA